MSLFDKYKELINIIENDLNSIKVTTNKSKIKVAATLFVLSIDNAKGVCILLENEVYQPASVLMRVIFESYIRAMWVCKCANDNQVDDFIRYDRILSTQGKPLHFKDMITQVEKKHCLPGLLSKVHGSTWNGLNSLTHVGMIQLNKNFNGKSIGSFYSHTDIDAMIQFSTMIVCLAFSGLLDISNNPNSHALFEKIEKFIQPWVFNNSHAADARTSRG